MPRSRPITQAQVTRIVSKLRDEDLPAITARVARIELDRVLAAGPAPYVQFVDGREGAPLESVRPYGLILFQFNRLGQVLNWIYRHLVEISPIGPDTPPHLHYFEDHQLYINDVRVNIGLDGTAIEVPEGGIATIVNMRPYARKLEHGLSIQAPSGVYEITAAAASRLFPQALIEFDYTALPAGSAVSEAVHRAAGSHARHASYRYPAITVRARR